MPQKNIIFDLGAVMVDWNPLAIAQQFTSDPEFQQSIIQNLFLHENWIDFDNGKISEALLIRQAAERLKLSSDQTQQLMLDAKESLHAKTEMVDLLQLAKTTGLKTYCLSNLSHEWFAYLSHRHNFFQLFDGKVISAQEGMGKPNIEIYQTLLTRYNVNRANTLFIDDRSDNTQAATSLGINCITFEHSKQNLMDIRSFILTKQQNKKS